VLGSTIPREWTRPLVEGPPGPCGCGCALTAETSLGFAFEEFCRDVVRQPLDPWQRWLGIHGLEMLPDGRPRFRQLLVLVARQNGKTELLVLLTLFWMYVVGVGLVLGTSTKLDYARESWLKVVKLARAVPDLRAEIAQVRSANGEQEIATVGECRYKIAASNEEGGRSLTVHRLVEDELRQHRDWSAHEAAENAMNAVPDAQAWAISNEGDDRAVVLTALKSQALTYITTGAGDERLGYFGWTAPDDCACDDIDALAAANPNLGRRIDTSALLGKAARAREAGGEQEAKFRTEVLCQRVKTLVKRAIDPGAWAARADPASVPGRDVVFAVDMSHGGSTCAIAVAGRRADGRAHIGVVDYRPGTDWVPDRLAELVATHDPLMGVLWEPTAPIGALAGRFEAKGIWMVPMSVHDVTQACGALRDDVLNDQVRHQGTEVLDDAFDAAEPRVGIEGAWRWGRGVSGGDICPLVAATEALWGLAKAGDREPGVYEF
jgi:hypothetical protein